MRAAWYRFLAAYIPENKATKTATQVNNFNRKNLQVQVNCRKKYTPCVVGSIQHTWGVGKVIRQ
jgi:hypothetical protein